MEGAQNSLLPRLKRGWLYGICLLLFFPCLAVAQQYDYLWHFGNSNLTDTTYAGMTLNFFGGIVYLLLLYSGQCSLVK